MTRLFGIMSIVFASAASAQSSPAENRWSYLAAYEDGPGSIRLNLSLRDVAPMADYPNLVVTGPTYTAINREGLPEAADLKRLNHLQERVVIAIAKQTPYIYAGTFTHNFEQLHYVYVKSGSGISQALAEVYKEHCPGCKVYTNIKHDPSWSAYSEFLFPNQATREHYGLQIK